MNTNAVLVRLTISQWYNQRADKKVSDEVAERYNISDREDKYIKTLLPRTALRNIQRKISEIRAFHYANTLPWQDDSVRILSSENLMPYRQGLALRRDDLDAELTAFLKDYPKWLALAEQSKKGLFDASQYPSANGFRESFKVNVSMMPFPDVGDFRLDISGPELDKLKQESQAAISNALQAATQHLVDRIYERVYLLWTALGTPDKVFHDRTVTSVLETADMVEKLNISKDAKLTYAIAALRTMMEGLTPEMLRTGVDRRNTTAKALGEFLTALKEPS